MRAGVPERRNGLILTTIAIQGTGATPTHWSRRGLADPTGVPKTTVHGYLALFGLQPHRAPSFKLSTDPFFIEKVLDVVGL